MRLPCGLVFATVCQPENPLAVPGIPMSETVDFDADDVELDTQTGFVGFANTADECYFWLQPGETSTGLSPVKDEIWLERDDQQFGGSGGNWNIMLTRESATIDTHQLPWMACDKVVIRFQIDDAKYHSLKGLLQRVMIGSPDDLSIVD